jgi:ribosomal protein S18 acetylase RimI-like enzyme
MLGHTLPCPKCDEEPHASSPSLLGRLADMQIRPYCDTDWVAVRNIYDLAKPDEMQGVVDASAIPPLEVDPDMMALFHDSQILVLESGSQIVGFAGSRGTSITWLFVHPEYRRKGVAQALVREMLARLVGTITLNVATTNVAAYTLYKHLGFTVEREFVGQFNGHSCPVAKLRYEIQR